VQALNSWLKSSVFFFGGGGGGGGGVGGGGGGHEIVSDFLAVGDRSGR